MSEKQPFSAELLRLDAAQAVSEICDGICDLLSRQLKRRGLVVGLSGGIDSSVTAALAVHALGPQRVLGLLMPERSSSADTLPLSTAVADHLGIRTVHEDITGILESLRCYHRFQSAARKVVPEYSDGWRSKIVISSALDSRGFSLFHFVFQAPGGTQQKRRLPHEAYLEIVAATNFKQRTRKMLEYYHADRLHYAVAGTPNRLEYDQGFFVKLGDGAADVKPIAHLYKTQVYQLAEQLRLPEQIRTRPPTTDTYSLPQGQDEFYFSLPYDKMDLCLYGKNNGIAEDVVAAAIGLTREQVEHVYADIDVKRSTTRYLHLPPLLVREVREVK